MIRRVSPLELVGWPLTSYIGGLEKRRLPILGLVVRIAHATRNLELHVGHDLTEIALVAILHAMQISLLMACPHDTH